MVHKVTFHAFFRSLLFDSWDQRKVYFKFYRTKLWERLSLVVLLYNLSILAQRFTYTPYRTSEIEIDLLLLALTYVLLFFQQYDWVGSEVPNRLKKKQFCCFRLDDVTFFLMWKALANLIPIKSGVWGMFNEVRWIIERVYILKMKNIYWCLQYMYLWTCFELRENLWTWFLSVWVQTIQTLP